MLLNVPPMSAAARSTLAGESHGTLVTVPAASIPQANATPLGMLIFLPTQVQSATRKVAVML